jgi:hypothetical protein
LLASQEDPTSLLQLVAIESYVLKAGLEDPRRMGILVVELEVADSLLLMQVSLSRVATAYLANQRLTTALAVVVLPLSLKGLCCQPKTVWIATDDEKSCRARLGVVGYAGEAACDSLLLSLAWVRTPPLQEGNLILVNILTRTWT